MIATLCFLQYASVSIKPRPPAPNNTRYPDIQRIKPYPHGLGLGLAVALHLAWLYLPEAEPKSPPTPPQAIMVGWVSAPEPQSPAPPPPKPSPAVEKPVKKVAPKSKPKAPESKPLLTANNDTAAEITAPAQEPEPPQPAANSSPQATQPAGDTQSDQPALTLPNLHADYLNNPAPVYPNQSRRLGEQGRVLLRVLVNASGSVDQITLRKSSGYPMLDSAAQDTVKTWRFVPAKRGDHAVTAWVVVPISFSLEG